MANRTLHCFVLAMLVLSLPVGCGGRKGPEFVAVKGVVKYEGKGVGNLLVSFVPDKGLLATGKTDDQGNFRLTTNKPNDGAMVGNYKVSIRYMTSEIPPMQGLADGPAPPASPIPTKYADPVNSGLTGVVDKDASKNNFTFELN